MAHNFFVSIISLVGFKYFFKKKFVRLSSSAGTPVSFSKEKIALRLFLSPGTPVRDKLFYGNDIFMSGTLGSWLFYGNDISMCGSPVSWLFTWK